MKTDKGKMTSINFTVSEKLWGDIQDFRKNEKLWGQNIPSISAVLRLLTNQGLLKFKKEMPAEIENTTTKDTP